MLYENTYSIIKYGQRVKKVLNIILLHEYLTMHYNQFAHLSASIQRNICLQPPPLLLTGNSNHKFTESLLQRSSKKQMKITKQNIKNTKSKSKQSLQSKVFEAKQQIKNVKDIKQMLKQKLKVSEYAEQNNQICQSGNNKFNGGKRVCKDRRQKYKQVAQKIGKLQNGSKTHRNSLVSSQYDGFFKPKQDNRQPTQKNANIYPSRSYSSVVQKSKQLYNAFHPIRSSSVLSFTKANSEKRIRFVLKTTKKANKNEAEQKDRKKRQDQTNSQSTSSANQIYYNLELMSSQFNPDDLYIKNGLERNNIEENQYEEYLQKMEKQASDFRVTKRNNRKNNIKKFVDNQDKKCNLDQNLVDNYANSDDEKIDAWKDKAQLGSLEIAYRATDPLRRSLKQQNQADQITQFIKGQKILF